MNITKKDYYQMIVFINFKVPMILILKFQSIFNFLLPENIDYE